MTYLQGQLIQAADFNGFANDSANNLGNIWGTGSGDKGWGQSTTAIANAAVGSTVTATQWAALVANLATAGSQTSSTLTTRAQPQVGNTISILANVATDINTVTGNRGNAAAIGAQSASPANITVTTDPIGSGTAAWTITWTQTVTFANANAARYFWNAGGLVRLDMTKTSTGRDSDPDWNTFIGTVGTLYVSGRVNSAAQTIAGTSYTGFYRSGGSGTPSPNLTTTGWYALTQDAAAVEVWRLTNATAPYTGDYVSVLLNRSATVLTITTKWFSAARTAAGENTQITGAASTGPTVNITYYPPSTTYLTVASWGTPTLSSSFAIT